MALFSKVDKGLKIEKYFKEKIDLRRLTGKTYHHKILSRWYNQNNLKRSIKYEGIITVT